MKIAYIILAHKSPGQLIRLISKLNTANASFFIHVDQNTRHETYQEMVTALFACSSVHFISRAKCYWGDFSLVKATLQGIQEIIASSITFDYTVLLSGQDYPLVPAHKRTITAKNLWNTFRCLIQAGILAAWTKLRTGIFGCLTIPVW